MAAKLPGLSPRHCQALDTSSPLSSSIFPGQADPPAALVLCSKLTSIFYRLSLPLILLWKLVYIFPLSSLNVKPLQIIHLARYCCPSHQSSRTMLHTLQSFGISYRNWTLWDYFCQHLPLCFSLAAEQTHNGFNKP